MQMGIDWVTYTLRRLRTWGWTPGSYHYLCASTPQVVGGVQYEFVEWEDGSTASATGTGGSDAQDVYGQVRDEVRVDDEDGARGCRYGDVRGTTWWTAGTTVPVTQTGIGDYAFTGWSGACSGTGACLVTIDSSKEVTANYVLGSEYTVQTNPAGRQVTVDGQTYTSPKTFTWIPGSTHTIGVTSPQAGTTGRDTCTRAGAIAEIRRTRDGAGDEGDVHGELYDAGPVTTGVTTRIGTCDAGAVG